MDLVNFDMTQTIIMECKYNGKPMIGAFQYILFVPLPPGPETLYPPLLLSRPAGSRQCMLIT